MTHKPAQSPSPVILSEELSSAAFGDQRLSRRLGAIVAGAARAPEKSFPQMARSDGDLEGTYRFLGNEDVTPERILEPHYRATCDRLRGIGAGLVVHDTSTFTFGGDHREDFGWVSNRSVGFYGHFALALSADPSHLPLGVLGMSVVSRSQKWGEGEKKTEQEQHENPNREFRRWGQMVRAVEERAGVGAVIHVMDREADSYELFAAMMKSGARFVIRMAYDRVLAPPWPADPRTLTTAVEQAKDVLQREVPISARRATGLTSKQRKIHPPRAARVAKLHFRAATVSLKRPVDQRASDLPDSLSVNVVDVREVDAPEGEEPISWRLVTTEPVTMVDQVAAVVDHYRGRWTIEEFFKAIKTGCALEARQLESKRSMLNALAIFAPIAWQLLTLRSVARNASSTPATVALTDDQLQLLRASSVRVKLPLVPTVREAMLAIAGLGGHLKRNGEPGWLTLARGFRELLVMEAGWLAQKLQHGDARQSQSQPRAKGKASLMY